MKNKPMKIMLVGNFRGSSGWNRACKEYALALDTVCDVVVRNYDLNHEEGTVDPRILELEKKNSDNTEFIVHCGLPHNAARTSIPSGSILFTETDNYSLSSWPRQINITSDILFVPNQQAAIAAVNSGITIPIKVLPVPLDPTIGIPEPDIKEKTYGDFIFYTIADMTPRKGLHNILKAFHLEFSPNEPVSLLLKLSKFNTSPKDLESQFMRVSNEIKTGLKIRPLDKYKKEVLICDRLSDQNIQNIHASSHCFLNSSYGEAFGFPLMDALKHGNTTICNDVGAASEYSTFTIPNFDTPCFGEVSTFDFLFTGYETWKQIDIGAFRKTMRMVYETHKNGNPLIESNKNKVKDLTYKIIGEKLLNLIGGVS